LSLSTLAQSNGHVTDPGPAHLPVLQWTAHARCQHAQIDSESDIFFPEKGGSTKAAKLICNGGDGLPPCPVKAQCLAYALENDEKFGIWGGLNERERRKLKRLAGPEPSDDTEVPANPPPPGMKVCVVCGDREGPKPEEDFPWHHQAQGTRRTRCRACGQAARKTRRATVSAGTVREVSRRHAIEGLSISELANEYDLSYSTVQAWLRGERRRDITGRKGVA
jgi:WhiB family redox-sensing transcriptional regulator